MKHLFKHFIAAALFLAPFLGASPAWATNCPPFTFTLTNGQTADANQVMSNFNTLLNCSNNNLAHNGANTDITSLSGLTTLLTIAQGGTSLSTWTAHSVTIGEGTSAPNFIMPNTAGYVLTDNGSGSDPSFQAIPATATSGFINRLRNNSLTSWFHGCVSAACTITTAGGWCAEGVYVIPAGASVTCQQTGTVPTGSATYYGVKITGNTSVSDVTVRLVEESYSAAPLAGVHSTFQFLWLNNTGGSVSPTLQTRYPATQDSWGSPSTDLNTTSLQSCTNGSSCTEAYTLAVSANAKNGYEENIDFGNNFSSTGSTMTLAGGFDFRAAPTATTGLTASPQAPEVRDAASDIEWNERFYQTSYDNGTLPGTSTRTGIVSWAAGGTSVPGSIQFRVQMRGTPSMSNWDGVGNASKCSFYNGSWTDNTAMSSLVVSTTNWNVITASADECSLQYVADATIVGG